MVVHVGDTGVMFLVRSFKRNVYANPMQRTGMSGLMQAVDEKYELVGSYVYPYEPYGPLWRQKYTQLWAER